jgi:hypothetical protein
LCGENPPFSRIWLTPRSSSLASCKLLAPVTRSSTYISRAITSAARGLRAVASFESWTKHLVAKKHTGAVPYVTVIIWYCCNDLSGVSLHIIRWDYSLQDESWFACTSWICRPSWHKHEFETWGLSIVNLAVWLVRSWVCHSA